MSHDAERAQKELIRETRGKYEEEKIFKKFEKLNDRLESMEHTMREMAKDIQAIKERLTGA